MKDILDYPRMEEYLKIFYSEYLLEMFPEALYEAPLARLEQVGKTPWGEPFSIIVDQFMDGVNLILDICENKERRCISLWDKEEGDWSLEREKKGGREQVFLLAPAKQAKGAKKPAVIICPGGGYEGVCFSGEGTPVLRFMEAKGYQGFILKYRVSPERYPKPQEDLALAIRYVRCHAKEYGIDENNVLVIGASAGGHLCALEAAMHEKAARLAEEELEKIAPERVKQYTGISAKPNKICLSYPVISFETEPHEGSVQALTGGNEELRKALSVENLITKDYPPTFVWTCADDDCVPPSNAINMGKALNTAGVPCEMHVYPSGGHGCGLAYSKEAYDWSRAMTEFMEKVK